jgi:copper resistance protein B
MDPSQMRGMDHAQMPGVDHAQMPGVDHSQMPGMDHSQMPGMEHAQTQGMDHAQMPDMDPSQMPGMDHAQMPGMDHAQTQGMGHSQMPGMDHAQMRGMDHSQMPGMDHSQMQGMDPSQRQGLDHSTMAHDNPPDSAPRTPIPVLTDADRAAAFPPVHGHATHDRRWHSYWLVDRLELADTKRGTGASWNATAWIGGDTHRLWLRSEGERVDGTLERADLEVLAGRSVSRWWDVVAGVRHDFGEGPSQTFAAIGVTGKAPYKFEVDATAYIGTDGQTAARLEAEYDTLLTHRLILQWQAEAELFGKDDASRGVGSGLSTVEAGARLRYEVTRKFAPYIGIVKERSFGDTADFRRARGEPADDTRVVAGVRLWF